MTVRTGAVDRWFVNRQPRPEAPVALLCLPYGGAGPSAFREWPAAFGAGVDVAALALPGRENRYHEPPDFALAEVADAVARRAGARSFALYGHSMGGRIAVEVVHELHRRGGPLPVRLFLGGTRAPDLPDPFAGLSTASDAEVLDALYPLGGVPAEVLAEPELRELLLPVIRADLRWLDGNPPSRRPVPVPLSVFAGVDDPVAGPGTMLGWLGYVGAGFALRTEPGDHFFLHSGLHRLVAAIGAELAGSGRPQAWPADDELHLWLAAGADPGAALRRVVDRYPGGPSDVDTVGAAVSVGGTVAVVLTRGHEAVAVPRLTMWTVSA